MEDVCTYKLVILAGLFVVLLNTFVIEQFLKNLSGDRLLV